MTTTTEISRPFRIVVALDLSEYSEVVIEHALDQAARHPAPELHFVTVVADANADVEGVKYALAELVFPALDGLDASGWNARLQVRAGKPHEEIASLAAEIRAHLIVVGRFGLHHRKMLRPSVASRVIDLATAPTLVVGLADDSPDAIAPCPDCAAARTESDGERWFCAAHTDGDRASLASVYVAGPTWLGGGPMW